MIISSIVAIPSAGAANADLQPDDAKVLSHPEWSPVPDGRWNGWSQSWPEVQINRVVAVLLGNSASEPLSDSHLLDTLDLLGLEDLSVEIVIERLTCNPELFRSVRTPPPTDETQWHVTPHGRHVAGQFRTAQESGNVLKGAQRALLWWCDAHPPSDFLRPEAVLCEPAGWFYGTQFTVECLHQAVDALTATGFLLTTGTGGRQVIQLAAAGVHWASSNASR